MLNSDIPVLAAGQARVFPLPPDRTCASVARSSLSIVMRQMGLPADLVDDGALMVSELSTNALVHARENAAELWVWARTSPRPALVVSVFDADPRHLPASECRGLLAESGKGLAIVAALAEGTGAHRSRSRLRPCPVSGKAVWFSLALPDDRPAPCETVTPLRAVHRLVAGLCVRGLFPRQISEDGASSVATIEELRVEITSTHYTWRAADGEPVRVPLADAQDAVEAVIARIDTA
ncbi:ATP-binding protein [Actinomadura gamaensis]|uniref:ATP-binding protein n=1 Tax=Actinomadura gamaensis TaxID=1763541 RepID=A0ABV9TZ06_9ACTN